MAKKQASLRLFSGKISVEIGTGDSAEIGTIQIIMPVLYYV